MRAGYRFDETNYEGLLDSLYGASTDETRWSEFLGQLTNIFGGRAVIYRFSAANRAMSEVAMVADRGPYTEAYQLYYHQKNVWITEERPDSIRPVSPSESVVSERELIRTEFYADYLRPQDLRHGLSCHLVAANDDVYRLGLLRSKRIGAYGEAEQRLIGRIRTHMRRAVDIAQHVGELKLRSSSGFEALDRLQTAALVVDAEARVQCSNGAAEALLCRCSALRVSHGRLRGEADVRAAIAAATGDGRRVSGRHASVVAVSCRETGASFSVSVSPTDARDAPLFGAGPLALVLISAQDQPIGLSEGQLRAAYALTPAEARLAAALCGGHSLASYAGRAGIGITTAKWHLRSLFEKTGERRQVDLVRRLSSDPALRAA